MRIGGLEFFPLAPCGELAPGHDGPVYLPVPVDDLGRQPVCRAAAELDGRYQHPEDLPGGPPHAYRLPQQPTIPPSPFTASAAPVQEVRASTPEPPPLTKLVPVQEVPIKAWKAAAAPPHYLSDPFRP